MLAAAGVGGACSGALPSSIADDGGVADEMNLPDVAEGAPLVDGARELDALGENIPDVTRDTTDAESVGDVTDAGVDVDDAADATTVMDAADAFDAAPALDAADASDAGPPLDCTLVGAAGEPLDLGCTGLYSSWPTRTLATDARFFDPGIHFWSDGAEKSRWISIPAGKKIDTSVMDEWTFPVGTKLWKEFRLGGVKVETRLLWKRTVSSWYRTVYVWSTDQSSATELTTGRKNVNGTTYEIPSQGDCLTCHQGHIDGVLGFEAIGLSSPGASGETMAQLIADGLITNAPAAPLVIPGNATEVAALGWLHANCGNACHSPSPNAFARRTGLHLRLYAAQLGTVVGTDTYRTSVGVASAFQPFPDAGFQRIKVRDVTHSCVPYRDGIRDGAGVQMPPITTHIVDDAGLTAVSNWINTL